MYIQKDRKYKMHTKYIDLNNPNRLSRHALEILQGFVETSYIMMHWNFNYFVRNRSFQLLYFLVTSHPKGGHWVRVKRYVG